mmetsp:Transcript_30056/g.77538  ORF Transcript_30056/g.77538 Transcript_30056/m.77538 type:complete len:107 (+) Transcript_30056:1485-1805(+)
MRRMDEYRKQLLLGKFNEKMKRADVIDEAKEDLLRRRREARMESTLQRQTIFDTFEKLKITKKWDNALDQFERGNFGTSSAPTSPHPPSTARSGSAGPRSARTGRY